MSRLARAWFAWLTVSAAAAFAQPEPAPMPPAPAPTAPEPEPALATSDLAIHGFVTQGGFVSTANDYLGKSSRGSLELFEAGLNVSKEITDQLRVGMQLFTRDVGKLGNYRVNIDWAYIDYRYRPWLGFRAGHIKLPFGLYNEYTDIDSARLPILMPQALYPINSRDVLLAHTGTALYGSRELGSAGALDYQVYLGSFFIAPATSATVAATEVDSKYVVGAQVFWRLPIEELRIGASALRTSIDYQFQLDQMAIDAYVASGTVPADFDGKVALFLRPGHLLVGSIEYVHGDWMIAAEYSRWLLRFYSVPPIVPLTDSDSERFYALATYRVDEALELGGYYSVLHADAGDRQGRDETQFPVRARAFQRDAAATLRYDINDNWLFKLEAHFIDGVADLDAADNAMPERYWGMFLARTTLTF